MSELLRNWLAAWFLPDRHALCTAQLNCFRGKKGTILESSHYWPKKPSIWRSGRGECPHMAVWAGELFCQNNPFLPRFNPFLRLFAGLLRGFNVTAQGRWVFVFRFEKKLSNEWILCHERGIFVVDVGVGEWIGPGYGAATAVFVSRFL